MEATVRLSVFRNETQVREILRSHGFAVTDLSSDRVRVKGSFLKLGAAKASLETLLNSQHKTDIAPSSSSPVPKVSSGATSKGNTNRSDANRSQLRSRSKHASSPPACSSSWVSDSSNNHQTPPERSTFSPTPDQRSSSRAGKEVFVVDADVFDYAKRLHKKDIDSILDCHNVRMVVHPVRDSYSITLQGKSAGVSVGKLQSLLDDLNKSLRTQEVPLMDMKPEGKALLERIQKKKNIYGSVLVCPKEGKLHLIGPSGKSYELKQRLLGRPADQSGRTGGTSKYQEIKQEVTEPEQGAAASAAPLSGAVRRRSHSESRHKNLAGRTTGDWQDTKNKHPPPKTPNEGLAQLLKFNAKDIKQKFKNLRK